jgi:hypothetical protein
VIDNGTNPRPQTVERVLDQIAAARKIVDEIDPIDSDADRLGPVDFQVSLVVSALGVAEEVAERLSSTVSYDRRRAVMVMHYDEAKAEQGFALLGIEQGTSPEDVRDVAVDQIGAIVHATLREVPASLITSQPREVQEQVLSAISTGLLDMARLQVLEELHRLLEEG